MSAPVLSRDIPHRLGAPRAAVRGAPRPHAAFRLGRTLLWILLGLAVAPLEARAAVRQVLVLESFDRGILVLDHFTSTFLAGLDQRAGPVNVVQVVVGPTGFVGASDQAVVDYIQAKFANRPPDLIVTVAGPAASFARRHRPELFPVTPLVFASVDQRFLAGEPLADNETAVAVVNDFPRLVDDMLRLLPETRQVFMVTGAGPLGTFWRQELESSFARFRGRVTFVWTDQLSFPEIIQRSSRLPSGSAIFYLLLATDAQGGVYTDEKVLADLHAKANAPIFGALSPLFGRGIVGGTMVPIGDLGVTTADLVNRILAGASPRSLRIPPRVPGRPAFDWRELQRWNIPESRLPPGSVVAYRAPSLWDEHRRSVLGAGFVLLLQLLLIAWLLYERRARQRAEIDSRRNLALAADANRRETMSALTASIGHELGQPLSAMIQNARALQMMVTARDVPAETVDEIVTEMQASGALAVRIIDRHRAMLRNRQPQRSPLDLHAVIDESLALLAHDLGARRIVVSRELSAEPCVVDGDPVLLQQVMVNLLRNAMDALAQSSPAWRRIAVRSEARSTEVTISVSDTGPGVPPEVLATLFTPFVTTKPNGLGIGLTITKSIVDAHAGTIAAHQETGGGATFTVTLPRRARTELLPALRTVATT